VARKPKTPIAPEVKEEVVPEAPPALPEGARSKTVLPNGMAIIRY